MKQSIKPRPKLDQLVNGILQGDRVILGQAITLVESKLEHDARLAESALEKIIHKTGQALRIGITGAPGVGKSTFIEAFGKHVTGQGKKLAVLTIDPSSPLTKGSILGDKTRMEELARNPLAFIRPTAASSTLGGVAHKTREAMLLCEAAGYEVIIIETVGVGQSEVAVKSMVDFFLLLMLAGAGDELQGIKRGIVEIADAVVISKADGDNVKAAAAAQTIYQQALHLLSASESGWKPPVLTASAVRGEGIEAIWKMILRYQRETTASGFFEKNRRHQHISWFRDSFSQLLQREIEKSDALRAKQKALEQSVMNHDISSQIAARQMLEAYYLAIRGNKT
ncbi:MAG: methylmalonyl Co-A mutase-associated GTPase MeaB [Cyclobacteriaceae bacterium]|nr:methylmalonyl Co-A mutase-associated GTPase MeaB [Cyclobacteriaceae bacterium]MDH4295436.1 methylmalonyl Co-A mutase-associated GTPase MeaB [Cyclobacteriaceae bacterium]MDH5249647.1 methylmalonyl Co-A mutase-associated GTPase MeaB [Cyclobacteriaceae bacterium]